MISIYAFSLFLWICLAVQVPAEEALRKITKVKRADVGKKFKLVVEFEGDSTVEALWYKNENGRDVNLTGSKLKNGKAMLKLAKKDIGRYALIILKLGHVPSHYVGFEWNVQGDGNRASTRNCPLATITPGLDLVSAPNETLKVQIAVQNGRGLDQLSFSGGSPEMFGQYWDTASNSVVTKEVLDFMEKSQESHNGVTTNTLTFKAGPNEPIVGYFKGMLKGFANDWDESPVLQMTEYFTVQLHKKGEQIPFPDTLN